MILSKLVHPPKTLKKSCRKSCRQKEKRELYLDVKHLKEKDCLLSAEESEIVEDFDDDYDQDMMHKDDWREYEEYEKYEEYEEYDDIEFEYRPLDDIELDFDW